MADYTDSSWKEVDELNTALPPNGIPAGTAANQMYGIERAARGAAKREYDRSHAWYTSGGTGAAYTLTMDKFDAYAPSQKIVFKVHANNTGACTLSINGLTPIAIQSNAGAALTVGQIKSGSVVTLHYTATGPAFIMETSLADMITSSGAQTISGAKTFTSTVTIAPSGTAIIEHGRVDGVASTPVFDIHSGATFVDYDSRIQGFGGTGTTGGGGIGFFSSALQWNGSQLVDVSTAQTITGVKTTATSNATTFAAYQFWSPTDYGVGKPRLAVTKSATATAWEIGLFDTVNNAGTLNLNASIVQSNGQTVMTQTNSMLVDSKSFVDNTTFFVDNSDSTKRLAFDIANIGSSTTRTWNFPDANGVVTGVDTPQTLTQKTLTNPTINAAALSGTITGAPTLSGNIVFSGVPTAPTAANLTNTTQIATTAFVQSAVGTGGFVTLTGAQSLSNKALTTGNTITGTIANTGTINGGTVNPTVLSQSGTGVVLVGTGQTIGGQKTFTSNIVVTVGTATTQSDYLTLFPSDRGTGKPNFSIYKESTAAKWTLGLDDGSNSNGQINIATNNFTFNDSQIYARSNVLGTVGQSSGTPTGAVVERGSNANGEYVKWADGTMICQYTDTTGIVCATTAGSIFQGATSPTWTFPVAFTVAPTVTGNVQNIRNWVTAIPTSASAANYTILSWFSSPTAFAVKLQAVGRWF